MKTGDSGSLKAGPEFWIFMGGGGGGGSMYDVHSIALRQVDQLQQHVSQLKCQDIREML